MGWFVCLYLASGGAYQIEFSQEEGYVSLHSYRAFTYADKILGESLQLPEVGKWTRFELSREFDETAGKYFLSLAIGGVEVVKAEDKYNLHVQPEDVEMNQFDDDGEISGFIKRMVVLEKS